MKTYLLIIMLVLGTSGCAGVASPGGFMYRSSQERKLSAAVSLLKQGKTVAAVAELDSICAGPSAAGVSDEALFLLSLLHLGSDKEASDNAQTLQDLERLTKEYPFSPWAPMASSLSKSLTEVEEKLEQQEKFIERENFLNLEKRELKRSTHSLAQKIKELKESNLSLAEERKKLKELNLSLTKENTELREGMKRLKNLDLELEGRIKH